MATDFRFAFPLANGMHARPASALEHLTRRFTADLTLINGRTGQMANAKSVLGIVGLDIHGGDTCRVVAVGRDAAWAIESVRVFVEDTLPRIDDALAAAPTGPLTLSLPPALRESGATIRPGTIASAGIAAGRAVSLGVFRVPESIPLSGVEDVEAEMRRVEDGFGRMLLRYDERLKPNDRSIEADVLRAHRSVARDPEFVQAIVYALTEHQCTAAGAVIEAEARLTGMLEATGSSLLRERALDIRDVCRDLLVELYGPALRTEPVTIGRESICVAETLTPGQFLSLDRRYLKGLVLTHGGATSHTVILARSHAVPVLVAVDGLDPALVEGQDIVVDADLGVVVTQLTEAARRYYDMEQTRLAARRARVQRFANRPAATEDGQRVEVAANIGSAAEVAGAIARGAEGIGLFRTEMLFMARPEPPGEDEQFEEYRQALVDAGGRPTIVRTFDVGGDKPLPYLPLPPESNPFLGYRAVRLYPEFEVLFRTQVRALARASAFGPLQVMIPMISSLAEVQWVRRVIADEQRSLAAAGVAVDAGLRVGAMIEVPSAAFAVGSLCAELDFFSLGTNDLLQYFLAIDRAHPRLGPLANPAEPSFLRLLQHVVSEAHARGKWVGLCGELGGQARFLPLLVGLGLDEISMAVSEVAQTKALLSALSATACRPLLERALSAATPAEVSALLDDRGHWRAQPLLEPELVAVDVEARTKAEALKAAADRMFAAGRTEKPRDIEAAAWAREAAYSTGFGNGFAIPHCKTDAVSASSLAIVRLREAVDWGAADGRPVRTILLLAVRTSDAADLHLRALASLARQLMHEEFRDAIDAAPDAEAIARVVAPVVSGAMAG